MSVCHGLYGTNTRCKSASRGQMVSYKGPGCVTCLLRHLWPVVIGKKCAWLITWFADLIFSNWKSSWLALKNDFDHTEINFDSCLKQFQRGKWLDNLVLQTTEREKGSGHVPADKLSPRNLIIKQDWIIRCWHLLNTIVMWLLHHNDKELALFSSSPLLQSTESWAGPGEQG